MTAPGQWLASSSVTFRGAAWVCPHRLSVVERAEAHGALLASPRHPEWARAVPPEGYVFIALGPCSLPGYDCLFLREVREAIGALLRRPSCVPPTLLSNASLKRLTSMGGGLTQAAPPSTGGQPARWLRTLNSSCEL